MSHELRTPAERHTRLAELLVDGLYGTLPAKALEILERIQKDGKASAGPDQRRARYFQDRSRSAHVGARQLLHAGVVETVVASTGSLAQAKGIEVKATVSPDLPMGYGDERRLTQVLLNIVGNAIKFTDTGSVEIRANARGRTFS